MNDLCLVLASDPAQFSLEKGVLVVEGKEVRRGCCDFDDGHVENAGPSWMGCSLD